MDDEELEFDRGALRVVHTPGHTPGSCSFLREADRTLIAGDCVSSASRRTLFSRPTPLTRRAVFARSRNTSSVLRACARFIRRLFTAATAMSVNDYEELFNRYLRAINERQAEVIRVSFRKRARPLGTLHESFSPERATCIVSSPSPSRSRTSIWRTPKASSQSRRAACANSIAAPKVSPLKNRKR